MNFPHNPTPAQLREVYKDGFQGWIWNDKVAEEWKEFCSSYSSIYATNPALKDLHKERQRCLLYLAREKFDPGAFTQEAQTTGDCTSHGDRTARDISRAVEILNGDAEVYYKRTATEPTYGMRGHRGQGMDPTRAAKFVTEYGFLFREQYSDSVLGISLDLSKYNANIGINWGRTGTPGPVKELCKRYNVGEWTTPKSVTEALDLMAAGKAGHSGQGWGTSGRQPSDGINRFGEGWNHDMACGGYDLTREYFKEEVVFIHNSWGPWNDVNPVWEAHEDVYGKWIPGTMVVPLAEYEEHFVESGSIHFYSDVKGFPILELPYLDIEVY
jgi:hypothetical protein